MARGLRIFLPLLLTRVSSPFTTHSFSPSSVRKAKKAILLNTEKIKYFSTSDQKNFTLSKISFLVKHKKKLSKGNKFFILCSRVV